jgi:hypothetical protein
MVSSIIQAARFCGFYRALQLARRHVRTIKSLLSLVANPAVSRKPRCAAVRNSWNTAEAGNRLATCK